MPSVVAAIAVLQSAAQTPQPHLAPMIGAMALVIAALIAALGTYWAQSRRFERFESDIAAQTARIRELEAAGGAADRVAGELAALARRMKRCEDEFKREQRLERLETDLILFFGSRDASKVMRVWIDAFTDRLGVEPVKSVTLAVYLRRVAEDEMMRRMAELVESKHADDIRREYEQLKRQLSGELNEEP